jgi:sulfatase maturation enzyme AslB (radical SAM superfamily)
MKLTKYFHFILDIIKSNLGLLSSPYKLNYVITKECHSKCLNCNIWQTKPINELTLEEVRSFSKSCSNLKWIDFTGGEPTDREDFIDIVEAFTKNCPHLLYIHFPTNGLKPHKIESVVNSINKLGTFNIVVSISVDGPQELNDKLRGIPGDFIRSVDTYKKLKKIKGVDSYFGMTLYESNYKYMNQTYTELKEHITNLKTNDLHINIGHHSTHYYGNTQSKDIASHIEMYEALSVFNKRKNIHFKPFIFIDYLYRKLLKKYIHTGKSPLACQSLKSSYYLSEHGVVYPCAMWDFPIGDIRDESYDVSKLLKSEKGNDALSLIAKEKCSHCWTPCEAYQTILAHGLKSFK